MKVTRTITFESDNYDDMERQCRNSAAPGTYIMSGGLKLIVEVIEEDIPDSIKAGLHSNLGEFPEKFRVKDSPDGND